MNSPSDGKKNVGADGISRRDFLQAAGMATLAMGSGALPLPGSEAQAGQTSPRKAGPVGSLKPKPHNVLFLLTDQERYQPELLSQGHWPGRDRLARMGTTFENHQICSAVCTPSRSVIFTGQHIQHTRMFDNTNFPWIADMSFDIPTIGHLGLEEHVGPVNHRSVVEEQGLVIRIATWRDIIGVEQGPDGAAGPRAGRPTRALHGGGREGFPGAGGRRGGPGLWGQRGWR